MTEPPAQEIELSIDSRCVVEAGTNCVRHAYLGAPGHPVRVRIVAGAERIELHVADLGAPVPEERRAPPVLEVDPGDPLSLQEGGRGIFLMHALMDEVAFGLEDGWNVLKLVKRKPTP